MEIRPGTDNDISAIVELLRISLGETLMPKSEAFWRWKHIDNPFGKSPVLLAFEKEQLVGVRAFMRWEWRQGDTIYKAVRAVDTATHPDHLGKGIFKTLSLQLADQCKKEEVHFIFNTPNAQSKPGYLKMGWQELGKLRVAVRPVLNFSKHHPEFNQRYAWDQHTIDTLHSASPTTVSDTTFTTLRSPLFFQWRYGVNPNIRYFKAGKADDGFIIVFRLKPYRFGTEFRIVDWFLSGHYSPGRLRELLFRAMYESGANVITYSGGTLPFRSITVNIGPTITFRSLNYPKSLTFDLWKPTLGDMEVF
ncbi:GNAT family N-acetyltransferase [Oscillatoria amoena NRMC-F 0135]|nr:GNAT family N-acetyltransferase [Oscillatoria amoena NRMC-F 0135]